MVNNDEQTEQLITNFRYFMEKIVDEKLGPINKKLDQLIVNNKKNL